MFTINVLKVNYKIKVLIWKSVVWDILVYGKYFTPLGLFK